jgi:IMP dehydrogenase
VLSADRPSAEPEAATDEPHADRTEAAAIAHRLGLVEPSDPTRVDADRSASARIGITVARRPSVIDQTSSASANRRVFRSRVDSIRSTYGFEDVSLAPGTETIEPADVELDQAFCGLPLAIPILAAAMDAVVDPRFAGELGRLGGLAVLNLEGVQARYDDPDAVLARIAAAPDEEVHDLLAAAYAEPIREELIARRIAEIHAAGSKAAVAATPAAARRLGPFCAEHGADLFLVQSQVSSARHLATGYDPLSLADFTRFMPIPVAVGNTTNSEAAFALMEQGAAAIFVGVGPGAACTTREVLGIGVPQVTAISDVAAARDAYHAETGRYVPVVADGGMRRGGELAKAVAAGADALMLGSPLARAEEAPGRGTNWGMATPSPTLPRGTRIRVGTLGSLERILFGPADVTDGSENLVGALRQSMAALGARTIADMQRVEMVHAPSVATEGKSWQRGR